MRPFMFLLVAVLFAATPQLHGQSADWCGFDEQQQVALTEIGGAYMPAFGTIKALMVFIDFEDDTSHSSNQTWPVGTGPGYLSTIIDEDENSPSGIYGNITTYFNDMSRDNLHLIGTAVYRQARHSWADYLNNPQWRNNIAYWAMRHVIEDLDEEGFNFEDYDRWTRYGAHNIEPGPDGVVDMIFSCYRVWYTRDCFPDNNNRGFIAEGWADLGAGGDFLVDKGERTIQTDYPFWNNNGSGVTVVKMHEYSPTNPRLEHVEHEFGHYLGLPHNYSGGLWSLMGHRFPNVSSFMNSYEREQMGWIAFHDVGTNGLLVDMQDFGTEGIAYRLTIPGTSESFLIENHQVLSQYDLVDLTSGGAPGIYILHNVAGQLRVVAADGRWNWSNPYWIVNPWGTNPLDSIPVFKREQINRVFGYSDKVGIPHSKGGTALMHAWLDEQTGVLQLGPRYKGDGKDRFTFDENNMFSPWSAYAAYRSNGTATTLGVEVVSNQPNNKIRVRFYTTTPVNGPPSKPMDLRTSVQSQGGDNHPRLDWAAMQEPDVTSGGKLFIYSRTKIGSGNWSSWSLRDSVSGTTTSWVDNQINTAGGGPDSLQYKIQARDSQNKLSVFSDVASIRWFMQGNKIATGGFETEKPSTFGLDQNYPNPFNPTTTIKYQLAEDGIATLKVFDILGRDVATIAEGIKSAGYYSATFNADRLASGVYFVRFTVADGMGRTMHTKMSKLLLVR